VVAEIIVGKNEIYALEGYLELGLLRRVTRPNIKPVTSRTIEIYYWYSADLVFPAGKEKGKPKTGENGNSKGDEKTER